MIVAGKTEHAAVFGRARGIAMAKHVAAAVDAGALAVPDADHPVVPGAGRQIELLRAPDRGGREVFVHAGLELDVVLFEVLSRRHQLLVVAAERRTAISRDEARGVETRGAVAADLGHRQPNQRLNPGQEDVAGSLGVFLVETDRTLVDSHFTLLNPGPNGSFYLVVQFVRTSLCRFPQPTHHNSGQWSPASADSNFMPDRVAAIFALCRSTGYLRNDVAPSPPGFALCSAPGKRRAGAKSKSYDASDSRWLFGAVLLCAALACGTAQAASPAAETIAHGKALTEAADCAGCHTADPAKPFAGGRLIETPFGGIYSPNLTPDPETGLGGWSDDQFYRALHLGVAPDGSRYYPAFPYPNFTKLIRDDVLAIRAYLATLPPIRNVRPPSQLHWPLNYRVVMRAWNWLFFRPGIFEPDQNKNGARNRGGYLVEGAAHCGACHTPKNIFGADKRGQRFGGGRVQGWFAPRLDNAPRAADCNHGVSTTSSNTCRAAATAAAMPAARWRRSWSIRPRR